MNIKKTGKIPTKEDLEKYLEQREIPIRFCYPDDGGHQWHEIRKDRDYHLGNREVTALKRSLSDIKELTKDQLINLVHLGPGDGIEIPYLFGTFKPGKNSRYAGIDISEQMINNTAALNGSHFSQINPPLWYLTDIETSENLKLVCNDVKNKGSDINMILLIGQGVLTSNPWTLENIFQSMKSKDYLYITIEGDAPDKRKELCETYNLPAIRNLLSIGLERAGYSPEKGTFKTTFNEEKSRVEAYFKPEDEKEILCLTSYKPSGNDLPEKLKHHGFHILYSRFYEDIHTFAVLCKKGGDANV